MWSVAHLLIKVTLQKGLYQIKVDEMKVENAITKIVLDTFLQCGSWIEDQDGNIITKDAVKQRAIELLDECELSLLEICLQIVQEYDISILLPNGDSMEKANEVVDFQLHPNGGI